MGRALEARPRPWTVGPTWKPEPRNARPGGRRSPPFPSAAPAPRNPHSASSCHRGRPSSRCSSWRPPPPRAPGPRASSSPRAAASPPPSPPWGASASACSIPSPGPASPGGPSSPAASGPPPPPRPCPSPPPRAPGMVTRQCKGGPTKERCLSVFIRENGTNGNWTCFRANCGWKGYTQPDGVSKACQANKDAGNENESDQEVKANQPVKVIRKLREEDRRACEERIGQVVEKMKKVGIDMSQGRIGAFQQMTCPKCKGGPTKERSLSVFIRENGTNGNWTCFRANCGWKGYTQPDGVLKAYQANKDAGNENESDQEVKANQPVKVVRKLCEEDLHLEPLCDEIVIAFTYRRDEVLVGCKYREVSKRFSQEAKTEKILYGLDDIKQARDVIIVEGEIDKLSMEEAGYRNCVGVPDGASARVSNKLPDKDHLG